MTISSPGGWSPSQLTVERPDIWDRALKLCTETTGVTYVEKKPLPDGTIHACGGSYIPWNPEPDEDARVRRREEDIKKQIREKKDKRRHPQIDKIQNEIDELLRRKLSPLHHPAVYVPSGSMEWLLHEVGHWLASSETERALPNYGDGHEVAAFAFEDAVLQRPARELTVPTQRDGSAFVSGPIPEWAFRHIDKRLDATAGIDLEPFRSIWSEWVTWGQAQGQDAPWLQARTDDVHPVVVTSPHEGRYPEAPGAD